MYSGDEIHNFTSPLNLWRDLFITLDLEDFFSALTLNFAFLPWKLMVSHSQRICSLCPVFVVFCQNFCSQHYKFDHGTVWQWQILTQNGRMIKRIPQSRVYTISGIWKYAVSYSVMYEVHLNQLSCSCSG